MAAENDVHIVGISSLAAATKPCSCSSATSSKRLAVRTFMIVVGGVIPSQDYEFLKINGAAAVFGPGTFIPDAAKEILAKLSRALE